MRKRVEAQIAFSRTVTERRGYDKNAKRIKLLPLFGIVQQSAFRPQAKRNLSVVVTNVNNTQSTAETQGTFKRLLSAGGVRVIDYSSDREIVQPVTYENAFESSIIR